MNSDNVCYFDVNHNESRPELSGFGVSAAEEDINLVQDQVMFREPVFEGIVGQSAALRHALELVETVASSDSTVLLLGETGTGKELVARAIHQLSRRRQRALVKLNCAAIPSGLLESELFGHERGAFTGAVAAKAGRFETADQGTLFLDEVGDIPLELQPKLLRALQEREFERLGTTQTRKVDVRLIAATNCDLSSMIADRKFRSDLYYRLNVFPIRIPPLRERREDIPLLVRHFVEKYAARMGKEIKTISGTSLRQLIRWHWPGNIRELENLVERSVILTRGTKLFVAAPEGPARRSDHLSTTTSDEQDRVVRILGRLLNRALIESNTLPAALVADSLMLEATPTIATVDAGFDDQGAILRILRDTNGRAGGPNGAAARMGRKRTTLITRMKKLGIEARRVF